VIVSLAMQTSIASVCVAGLCSVNLDIVGLNAPMVAVSFVVSVGHEMDSELRACHREYCP